MSLSRTRLHRAIWVLHRVLGVAIGSLILLMSLTGGVLVMHHDLERWLFPERHIIPVAAAANHTATASTSAASARRATFVATLQQLATEAPPGYRPLRIELPHAADESAKALFVAPDGRTRWAAFVNPQTGAILWHGPDQALFTPWLLHLHMHLRSGGWGYVITSIAGGCLLLLGVSGFILHRKRIAATWACPLRVGQGWRIALTDLHRWLGTVSLYFSVVLGLTGAIYAGKIAPGQLSAPKPLAAAFDVRQLAPIEAALAEAARRFPGGEITRVGLPSSATASVVVTVLHRDAPVWRKFSRLELDPRTGAVRKVHDARHASPSEKFAAMLAPLHFGFHGSSVLKWLYVIGGFTPALLAVSGMAIWWLRQRRTCRSYSSAPAIAFADTSASESRAAASPAS